MDLQKYLLKQMSWRDCEAQCSRIRRRVFIEEQAVPEAEEWDGLDDDAMHLLILWCETQEAVACARLLTYGSDTPQGKIAKVTRLAVMPSHRRQGLGRALLLAATHLAKDLNYTTVTLDAQTQALDFYLKDGFKVISQPFLDAGIEHLKMLKEV